MAKGVASLNEAYDSDRTFGQRLAKIRSDRHLSLSEFGKIVGVTAACVCKWEKGVTFPTHSSVMKIATSLELSSDYLISGQAEIVDAPAATQTILKAKAEVAGALGVDVERIHITIEDD